MTTIKISFFAALLFGSLSASASDTKIIQPETMQIQHILQRTEFRDVISNETTINVKFIVNEHNELIVLSTDNESLDQTIKDVLNYKKLDVSLLKYNEVYTLTVTIK